MIDQPSEELDFLESLDLEIQKSTKKQSLQEAAKKLQSDLRNPRLGNAKREMTEIELSSISTQLQQILWKPISNVALFVDQHCTSCNARHRVFLQHMQRQVSTSGPKVDRLVRTSRPVPGYSNEVVLQKVETKICFDCADAYGFNVSSFTTIHGQAQAMLPSNNQEDLDVPEEED